MIVLNILLTIVFYFVLMWLSVNLLGFFIRGLFVDPALERLESEGSDFIKKEIRQDKRVNMWGNIVGFLLIAGYLYTAFYFWNFGVVIVALMLMIARLPDLLWEIKNGKKITQDAIRSTSNISWVTLLIDLLAFVALYYFLYY